MGKIGLAIAALAAAGLLAAGVYLKTPAPAPFDRAAALKAAGTYDARVIRDKFGVPHIYGARDADVAFGLAYAHAEDDWATIEDVLFFSRGRLAEHKGKVAAIPDYLVHLLHVGRDVDAKYETDLAPETRALVEGYAAGLNLWCAEDKSRCAPGAAPVSGKDVIAGFVSRTPFFYGLDEKLKAIFAGDVEIEHAADAAREALLRIGDDTELGSNAMAVGPSRSADGHTRLMVNSHQPYTGPVAWYEARVKSEEGWDMIGGLFPGAPMILHGVGPNLGWAHTVNKPDLVDVYAMQVDNPKKPTKYMFDGAWRDFDVETIKFRVKLAGPFSLPMRRRALYSVHGPVFVTKKGVFAVSYAGAGDIRSAEQWYRMDKAQNFDEWRSAMEMGAIPSFNVVYADREGHIAYFYNAAIPVRAAGHDWSKAQPGDAPDRLWAGRRPFSAVPQVVDPASGYVVNANNSPFMASGEGDNPDPDAYPLEWGVDRTTTNRGLRLQALYGADPSITGEEFVAYKMDHFYAEDSRMMEMVRALAEGGAADNPTIAPAVDLLKSWDGAAARDSRAAALAILTAQKARGPLINDVDAETPNYEEALHATAQELVARFGRIDPAWGEVVQLKRGDLRLALNGGPDTLRAVYPEGDLAKDTLTAIAGDSYILYADWSMTAGEAYPQIRSIHQFGAATLDAASPHYADQAPLFANEEWKTPPMTLEALLAEATSDERPGE